HESLEQAGEPTMIRRLLELHRVIEPLDHTGPLETELAAGPLDRARVPDEPDTVLARPRGPREEHGHQPARILEPQRRRVLHFVAGVPQAAGPGAHARRHAGDVEQLIHEMRAMVEQHAASSGRTRTAPGRP